MHLLSNVCNVPVILPHSYSAAVVVGAAMLGRFAAEVSGGVTLTSQEEVEKLSLDNRERLWEIMVRFSRFPLSNLFGPLTMREI